MSILSDVTFGPALLFGAILGIGLLAEGFGFITALLIVFACFGVVRFLAYASDYVPKPPPPEEW